MVLNPVGKVIINIVSYMLHIIFKTKLFNRPNGQRMSYSAMEKQLGDYEKVIWMINGKQYPYKSAITKCENEVK